MPTELDYKSLSQELLRAVRGNKSQAYLNQKLGFSGNQVYRWEKGLRFIDWADFVKLCKSRGIDLLKIFHVHFGYREKNLEAAHLVTHFLANLSIKDAVEMTGFSRSVLTKWMKGTTSPQLHHILHLLEYPNQMLLVFTRELVGENRLQSLETYEKHVQKLKEFYYEEPVLAGITAFLETSRFDSKKDFVRGISRIFQMDEARIDAILKRMVHLGLLEENNSYSKNKIRSVDTRGSFEGSLRLRKFWFRHGIQVLENIKSPEIPHLFPFFVFCVSEEANLKLREAHYRYISQLKSIIEEDQGEKTIVRSIALSDVELKDES